MIQVFPFAGCPVAVFGLGRSGLAAARALMAAEAEVWAWDDSEEARAEAKRAGIPLVDLYLCDWRRHTTLVLSPGVPLHHPKPHPVVKLAQAAGCEVIGDVELLARAMPEASFIGVTGTNGKSTTTALIGHVLKRTARPVEVGGNIGVPALELEPLGADGVYVLEMSSFQLELTFSITFDAAALLNVTPDHLERHGGMKGYVAAKKRIFHRQTYPRTAVVGIDDAESRAVCDELKAAGEQRVIPVSVDGPAVGGVFVAEGALYDDTEGGAERVMGLAGIPSLPGAHNWQNAAVAYAVARAVGVERVRISAAVETFPGLPHRQERLAVIDGVAFVNDSKATNGDAAAKALACYRTVYWIAGGLPKEGGLQPTLPHLGRVRHAFLIGQAAPAFAGFLEGRVPCTVSGDLGAAVEQALAKALADGIDGAVVLLSPACASFDQFRNFEARGDAFRALVAALPGRRADSAAADARSSEARPPRRAAGT
jgi:UDP-N-acetylmuramoylalanine--D-glutamate ligase